MTEPLPEELRYLVASETTAPVTSSAAQAAVRAKLGTTLGIATVGTLTASTAGGATQASAAAAKLGAATATSAGGAAIKGALSIKLLAVVLGAGTVATTVAVTRDRQPPAPIVERAPRKVAPATPAPALRVEPIEVPEPTPEPVVEPTPASEPPTSAPQRKLVTSPPAPESTSPEAPPPAPEPAQAPPPPSQSQLLADASRALSLGDAARALELLDEDARSHAGGPLGEEREALRISALTALGRTAEARDVARRLLATYPNSIHRSLAHRALAKETP